MFEDFTVSRMIGKVTYGLIGGYRNPEPSLATGA